jgi:glycogen debranching enzyme
MTVSAQPRSSETRADRASRALDTIERNVRIFRGETVVQPSPTYEGFWARDTMIIALGLIDAGRPDLAKSLLRTWATYQVRPDDDPALYVLLNKQRLDWTESEISPPDAGWLLANRGGLPTSVYVGRSTYPDGTREIYSCHPDPDSTAWWLIGCARHAEVTGTSGLVDALRPQLQGALDYLVRRDSDGDLLVEQCPNEDWADHWRRHGKVMYTQAVWYAAVKAAASMGLNGPDPAHVRRAIRGTLLRPSGPLDWQCPQAKGTRVTQDFALLVLYGVLDAGEGHALLRRLDRLAAPHGHRVITPSFASGRMGPYQFKRGEYQNGGIWTWLTGWEAQARAVLGETGRAEELIAGCFCPGCDRIYEWIEPRKGSRHNPDFATGAGSILGALARLESQDRSASSET